MAKVRCLIMISKGKSSHLPPSKQKGKSANTTESPSASSPPSPSNGHSNSIPSRKGESKGSNVISAADDTRMEEQIEYSTENRDASFSAVGEAPEEENVSLNYSLFLSPGYYMIAFLLGTPISSLNFFSSLN